jgi:hypothetical protein
MLPGIYKNGTKNGQFPAFVDIKIANNAVFYSKMLNKIYSQDIFEDCLNFIILEVYLFKVLGVIYTPSHPD